VSRLTKIFEGDFEKKTYELEQFVEESYQSVFEAEITKKNKGNVPVAYQVKTKLFDDGDGFDHWTF